MEIDLEDFLQKFIGKKIILIPNPGNAGDSIIALGTIHLFKKIGIDYIIGDIEKIYHNCEIMYGGGGNLIGIYNNCKNFLVRNCTNNKITILPHTIKDINSLFKTQKILENVTFICRELKSYNYVKNFTKNTFLSKDMAFYINKEYLQKFIKNPSNETAYCYRVDTEKTKIKIPESNKDISKLCSRKGNTTIPNIIEKTCNDFFNFLSDYKIIHTNRLHIAIAACLLEKEVYIHSNSYYKVEEVYNFSIKDKYINSHFIKDL